MPQLTPTRKAASIYFCGRAHDPNKFKWNRMISSENKTLATAINQAFLLGDVGFFEQHLSHDFEWHLPGLPEPLKREHFLVMLRSGGTEVKTSRVTNMIAEGNFVVVQSDGKPVQLNGAWRQQHICDIYEIEDGMLIHLTTYFDTAMMEEEMDEG
ncbi:hypothetical protein COR50_16865 [Chitinophaga caeni]|uniref:SnoaL-like domain-containing protein n=2 Tax=Chitinophaga caeni TaxID=2029983 RepID=A0A291QXP2_9BACT|nr:hypothetical protein COR50_16865 [Chitinophaga caeni]